MKLMQCKRCGGELNKEKDGYVCAYCHATYEDDTLERAYAELKNSLENLVGEQIEENTIRERERSLANLRRQLWDKTHEKYVNSKAIVKICREIKKIDSDDFAANFYETMNDESEDYAQVTDFLDEMDVVTQADYVDDVVEFVVKSLKIEYLTSLNMLVERAYTSDKVKYGEMISKIEAEAEKVEEGIYSLERPRDVFVAYSSKDVKRVNELVRYLEGQGIECFVAMRNLQQGRKSVENYEKALETAMDNCKVFLLVSSKNSRALSCDTIKRELPYIKRRDLECKPEYRNLGYDKMPEKYRKPRIQYRIDDERTPATDRQIKEFFGTLQWRYDLESVAEQVGTYLTEDVYEEREETPAPTTDKQDLYEEFKKRMREEEARKAEELRKAEERRQEELRKVEEQRKAEETRRAEELRKAEEARRAEELRQAEESASSDFEIENGVLKKYTGKEKDVVIPDGVTVIGEFAFNGAKMTSLKIPESVTIIKNNAFYYCNELANI
ncbi:MAG: leucine-rich repeat protein, partial [Clostridia bacterium]|nr:leucine-rich repeat protein [Clostridia bacterium]